MAGNLGFKKTESRARARAKRAAIALGYEGPLLFERAELRGALTPEKGAISHFGFGLDRISKLENLLFNLGRVGASETANARLFSTAKKHGYLDIEGFKIPGDRIFFA